MAFFRLEAKIIGREGRGRSIVAASAYRSGSKMQDEKHGSQIRDYTRRSKGVIDTIVVTPEEAPAWAANPETLWNQVERQERRKDSQLAREFILAVPGELSDEDQFKTAVGWAQKELVAKGMIAEVSLHHSKSGKNPHVHILCTMRRFDGDKFSAAKETDWNDKKLLVEQRASWAFAVNTALETAGRSERVDHRSLKDRGIDRIPEPKIGVAAMAMHRRGEDSERFQLVRYVRNLNAVRAFERAIQKFGEVRERGVGMTWWERSRIYAAGAKEIARDSLHDTWEKFKNVRMSGRHHELPPQPHRGPDMSR